MALDNEEKLNAILYDDEPSDEVLEWARIHINEDPDTKYQLIEELKDMIYAKGECNPDRTDDEYLLRFLRARHFDVRKAHRLIVNYHEFRNSNPQYFKNADIFRIRKLADEPVFSIPPYRDQNGRRMLILRIGMWDTTKYTLTELIQMAGAIIEMSVLEPEVQIKGGIFIVDLSEISLNLAWYMTPKLASDIVNMAGLSFPIRPEEVHFIFSSWLFDTAWAMIKPLLPIHVKDRIYFHADDLDSLHSHIEPKYLPKRYGGIHSDYNVNIWIDEVLLKNKKCYEEFLRLGYDISVLINNNKNEENKEEVVGEKQKELEVTKM